MEFKRTNIIWIIVSVFALTITQLMMVRTANLGGEILLQKEANSIKDKTLEATEIIKNSKAELFRIASLKSDSANRFGRFLKLQLFLKPLEVFVYHDQKPIFWTSSDYSIKPGSNDSITVESIGDKSVGIWRYKQGPIELVYVLLITKESTIPLSSNANDSSVHKETIFKVSPNPIDRSVPVITQSLPLFHLISIHQKPFWLWDLLFIGSLFF